MRAAAKDGCHSPIGAILTDIPNLARRKGNECDQLWVADINIIVSAAESSLIRSRAGCILDDGDRLGVGLTLEAELAIERCKWQ